MAKFQKGISGNPKGRPPGAKNKVKANVTASIAEFVQTNIPVIQAEFDKLEPKEKLKFFVSLLNYVIPKQQCERQPDPNGELDRVIEVVFNGVTPEAKDALMTI